MASRATSLSIAITHLLVSKFQESHQQPNRRKGEARTSISFHFISKEQGFPEAHPSSVRFPHHWPRFYYTPVPITREVRDVYVVQGLLQRSAKGGQAWLCWDPVPYTVTPAGLRPSGSPGEIHLQIPVGCCFAILSLLPTPHRVILFPWDQTYPQWWSLGMWLKHSWAMLLDKLTLLCL